MGRLITSDSTGTQRQRHRRTIAEAMRLLMSKPKMDAESRDLMALIVLSLREIHAGVDKSAGVWDKKHYYIKADQLRAEWEWTAKMADRMTTLLKVGDWVRLAQLLADLVPRFADVDVKQVTRTSRLWEGAYERLVSKPLTAGPRASP